MMPPAARGPRHINRGLGGRADLRTGREVEQVEDLQDVFDCRGRRRQRGAIELLTSVIPLPSFVARETRAVEGMTRLADIRGDFDRVANRSASGDVVVCAEQPAKSVIESRFGVALSSVMVSAVQLDTSPGLRRGYVRRPTEFRAEVSKFVTFCLVRVPSTPPVFTKPSPKTNRGAMTPEAFVAELDQKNQIALE